ncbi:Pentatricopeptide repeat-containing protein [Forsythia ovata]|uniref:Pentatricopeptide repeat-containing protein n=1 Tax=Forsythia ovata TaxID=205694 RepID=A0ABD1RNM1_9LAMI
MRESGCVPNAKTYNYLFGNLCKYERMDDAYKLLEEMNKAGSPPDASTFGVLIHFLCSSGKVDHAYKFLDQMASGGLVPLPKTHTSMVKALFVMEKYEEAHKYVVDSSVKYKTTSNIIYNFLADLHREKGDIISAQNVLVEMMEKGFKPNFISYINIVKRLKISGRANLACRFEG